MNAGPVPQRTGPPGAAAAPPGGGYGAPPGGFGGPPPGGGYGAPPGGFGGPPPGGGYGAPPGGFGGPPPGGGYGAPRPPPKKSNVGLVFAIGCGGLLLLSLVVGGLATALIRSAPPAAGTADEVGRDDDEPSSSPRGRSADEARVEVRALRFFRQSRTSKTIQVVAEIHNVSKQVVDSPRANLVLLDANKKPVGKGSCAAWGVHDLGVGNKVPCAVRITIGGDYKTYRVSFETSDNAKLFKAADVRLTGIHSTRATTKFGAHKVRGEVTNHSTFPAKHVQVVVGLYDEAGAIVGARRTMVPDAIAPGATVPFSLQIFSVAGKPAKSLTQVYGYDR